jgi:alkylresorcinol/alkylpyrone synthase
VASSAAPQIRAVTRTLPEHFAPQEEMTAFFKKSWASRYHNPARIDELHSHVQVNGRYVSVPLSELEALDSFAMRNDAYIRCATDLGERAVREALDRAELSPKDIDHIFFVSITGLATPSIDARLVNRLGMRPDVKRTPIWGLGCVGGAAGIARAADYLRGFPDHTAVLLSVELCLLTYQLDDVSVANIIATGLFGDGASAVILRGGDVARSKGPRVVATRACFYPDTERVMGWEIVDTGFKIVLSPRVPEMVQRHFGGNVDEFLASQGLDRSNIAHWLLHTGGPKVVQSFISTLGLPEEALDRTRRSLAEVGNLSSASVLFVLADLLDSGATEAGQYALLAAMGPAFCCEMVLLRW